MSEKLPYMPLYVFDLESDRDCRVMSDADFGRYMRLLIRQWVEGDVPGDVQSAIRDAALDPEAADEVKSLLDRKFPLDQGSRANQRLKEIREDMMQRVETNRTNAKKGGRPPKTDRKTDRLCDGISETKPTGPTRASGSVSVSGFAPDDGGSAEGGEREATAVQAWCDRTGRDPTSPEQRWIAGWIDRLRSEPVHDEQGNAMDPEDTVIAAIRQISGNVRNYRGFVGQVIDNWINGDGSPPGQSGQTFDVESMKQKGLV